MAPPDSSGELRWVRRLLLLSSLATLRTDLVKRRVPQCCFRLCLEPLTWERENTKVSILYDEDAYRKRLTKNELLASNILWCW